MRAACWITRRAWPSTFLIGWAHCSRQCSCCWRHTRPCGAWGPGRAGRAWRYSRRWRCNWPSAFSWCGAPSRCRSRRRITRARPCWWRRPCGSTANSVRCLSSAKLPRPTGKRALATPDPIVAAVTAPRWRSFYELTKPRVVMLIVFTSIVGTLLAVPGWPPWDALFFGNLGVGLAAASAAVINHVLDERIDAQMSRTKRRPLPTGKMSARAALAFAALLCVLSMSILWWLVNPLTALLTFASLIGYAVIYTVWLKRATSQNIVIGGAAGAAPPVLGWAAVTNSVDPNALLLFLIVFVWTPPHFWALAIARKDEYAKVGIPMLPVTHGVAFTRLQVLLYTMLLTAVTLMPFVTGMSGLLYLGAALVLNGMFVWYAWKMRTERAHLPMKVFRFSITYLMWLFAALLVDHYLPTTQGMQHTISLTPV